MAPSSVVRRYYAYAVTTSIGFYIPVGVVFLAEVRGFGLDAIGTIMAAYLVGMVVGEIPTGYLGDRVGRRESLAIGNALMAGSLVAWAFLQTPAQYVLLNGVWAVGTTFRSGTADAWLYELLDKHDATTEFARISGRASMARLLVSAGGALAAGALVTVGWTLPFYVNAGVAALGLPILVSLPAVDDDARRDVFTVHEAVGTLNTQVRRPELRWFVAYTALFSGLFQLALAFEQLALREMGVSLSGLGSLYAAFKLVSAGTASTAGWVQDRLGARGVFGLYAPVIGIAFAAVAVWPLLLVPVLVLNRGLNALTRPVRNQYLNDRFVGMGRATVLSGASIVLSLFAAAADLLGVVVAEAFGPVQLLVGAGLTAAGVAGLLWVTVTPVRSLAGSNPNEVAAVDAAE
jgi:predicted MFS family arabinose efflux permease